ncbi:hypothetical protein VT84_13620 [Gemmata sp. SH-PL17]|uniref:hypothetical protein n=1 Tax=Gemmata sp. SH-PL17 TaxID=1630693 RepID=UPI00078B4C6E|nr:hypothetical protein [Gemmata sp. SH-PL17]AMV25435.1 hypothetical protein VT84_13620 [Gemmata sp. SH-PL17]
MPIFLRQSTASQEIPLGYFLSSTDGDTAMTALSIANTDIKLWVNGATALANKNSGGATHIANGLYYCVLDATDSATIGPMVVYCKVATALATRTECVVLAANVYDTLFGTTALSTYAGGAVASVTGAVGSVTAGVTVTTNNDKTGYTVSSGTVTTLTNLPAAPTDWLTAAALKADAVTKIQSGLSTLTASGVWANATRTLTSLSGLTLDTVTTVTNAVTLTSAYDAAKTALTVSGYTAPDNASVTKIKAAVYDTATVSGNVITLSNGATQTVDNDGNRTTVG